MKKFVDCITGAIVNPALLLATCCIIASCSSVDNSRPWVPAEIYPSDQVTCTTGKFHHLSFTCIFPLTLEGVLIQRENGAYTKNYIYEDSEYIRSETRGLAVRQLLTGGAIEVEIAEDAAASGYKILVSIPEGLTNEMGWPYYVPDITIEMK